MASFTAVNATSYQVQFNADCVSTLDFSTAQMPKATHSKWGEVSLEHSYVGPSAVAPTLQSGTEIFQNFGSVTFSWNVITSDPQGIFTFDGGGGIELLIILNSLPSSNTITIPITLTNLNAYVQPTALPSGRSSAAWADPQRSPGSVVFYHATRPNFHPDPTTAARFQTCKAITLLAAVATDATGKTLVIPWALSGSNLQLVLDQNWLNAAAYPVTIDPTFGYTTTPTTSYDNNPGGIWFFASSTPASNGTLTSVTCNSCFGSASGFQLAAALYSSLGGTPQLVGTEIAGTLSGGSVNAPSTYGSATSSLSASITAGTQYWLGMGASSGSAMTTSGYLQYMLDSLNQNETGSSTYATLFCSGTTYTSWPSGEPSGYNTTNYSGSSIPCYVQETPGLYGTYTASGAGFLNTDYWWQPQWEGRTQC